KSKSTICRSSEPVVHAELRRSYEREEKGPRRIAKRLHQNRRGRELGSGRFGSCVSVSGAGRGAAEDIEDPAVEPLCSGVGRVVQQDVHSGMGPEEQYGCDGGQYQPDAASGPSPI